MSSKPRTPRSQRFNPASDDFHKEDFPFYWLNQVHGRYSAAVEKALKKVNANVVIIPMEQGNKISRFIAWRIQD